MIRRFLALAALCVGLMQRRLSVPQGARRYGERIAADLMQTNALLIARMVNAC